jgi:hypothetical protein
MNMLAIPFYLAASTILQANGWITLSKVNILIFVSGAVTGAFLLFYTYALFSQIIQRRAQFIASNINYILSALFLILGSSTLYNIWLA